MKNWLVIGICSLIMLGGCSRKTTDAASVRREILARIPAGSKASEVIRYLDSVRIEHSDYLENERKMRAIIRSASKTLLVRGDIEVNFSFDSNAILDSITVKEVFTGP